MLDPRCGRCHQIILKIVKTSEGDLYCHHCGHVCGTSVQPARWVCVSCGDTVLDLRPNDNRPYCEDCEIPMTCSIAPPSRIHGAGIGDEDLDLGLAMLMNAQRVWVELESDLKLGSELLRDAEEDQMSGS